MVSRTALGTIEHVTPKACMGHELTCQHGYQSHAPIGTLAFEVPEVPWPSLAAIMLYGSKLYDQSKLHLSHFRAIFNELDEDARNADPEVLEQSSVLGQLLGV